MRRLHNTETSRDRLHVGPQPIIANQWKGWARGDFQRAEYKQTTTVCENQAV